jgi:hypothetical protein
MSWAPNDLVTDADLLAHYPKLLTQFGQVTWTEARAKAIEEWLWPQLLGANFDPQRFRTRFAPAAVRIDANGTFTDVTSAAQNDTTDDLTLATAFATTSTRLCIGSASPFRGLSVRVADTPNATAATLAVSVWCDSWRQVAVRDHTQATSGVPFSRGGAITWALPEDWVTRTLDGTVGYWARLTLSVAPTAGKAGQVGVIRRSRLCGPVTHRTLSSIFRGAQLAQDGPWRELADWHEREADQTLARVLPILGGEFDTVTVDDVVDAEEAVQATDEARNAQAWTFERA